MDKELFWNNVDMSHDCWLWKKKISKQGYGKLSFNGMPWLAHRLSWFLTHRCMPIDACVLHKCDNPTCVNPEHLFLGTRLDNMADMKAKGRTNGNDGSLCGERQGLSKLTERRVKIIREQYAQGISQYKLAKRYRVHQTTIWEAIHKKTWKHVSP